MSVSDASSDTSSALVSALVISLVLGAATLVPSEVVRCVGTRNLRRRVYEPRLERRATPSVCGREAPPVPFAWMWVAATTDDTRQDVIDELGLDAVVYVGAPPAPRRAARFRALAPAASASLLCFPS